MSNDRNLRMTCQRRVILEELQKVTSHPTVDEVYEMVRKRLPRISLGTVYRNLEILTQRGLVQKLETVGNQKRFDGNVEDHSHIRCLRCGKIDDLMVEPKIDMRETIRQIKKYEVIGYWVECLGICEACQAEESP